MKVNLSNPSFTAVIANVGSKNNPAKNSEADLRIQKYFDRNNIPYKTKSDNIGEVTYFATGEHIDLFSKNMDDKCQLLEDLKNNITGINLVG